MTDAVILAAGKGIRLKPITDSIPKCMVKINDTPLIKTLYNNLITNGVKKIYIITNYLEGIIKEYSKGMDGLLLVHQSNISGTSDAINLIQNVISDDFIVLAGDTLYTTEDIQKLLNENNSILYTKIDTDFKLNRYGITLSYDEKLWEFGTIESNNGDIKRIHEKSSIPVSNLVNISGYHLTKDIFSYIDTTPIISGEKTITNTINLMIDNGFKFKGVYIENWYHITYPEDVKTIEETIK